MAEIEQLNALLQNVLLRQRRGLSEACSGGTSFAQVRAAGEQLKEKFDGLEANVPPPEEKRRKALENFYRALKLTPTEWRYVFAGLSDDDTTGGTLLQNDAGFRRVHAEVDRRIAQQQLSRRDWLALCFSYFSCTESEPELNQNWQTLRADIDRGFDAVCANQGREKIWMQVVREHRDLFGLNPGERLADEILEGRAGDLSMLESIAQVPGSSWLWRNIFAVVLSRIFMLDEAQFLQRLPQLIKLTEINPVHESSIIGACLTRYAQTSQRAEPCAALLDIALDRWGSPQMRTRQNLWLHHVDEVVLSMAVAWLAKQDLNHFFTLLKGEAGVDQSRLFYWLRYAEQMTFTRIVLGRDAQYDRSTDFVEFRAKNRGRLSNLGNATAANNAVIMQIGSYYFVEFSATGNACYVYEAGKAPFDPTQRELSLTLDLKDKAAAVDRWGHKPAPYRHGVVDGWLSNFDAEMRRLGISITSLSGQVNLSAAERREHFNLPAARGTEAAANLVARNSSSTDRGSSSRAQAMVELLQARLGSERLQVLDQSHRGGALQVQLAEMHPEADQVLRALGFKPKYSNPLIYWKN